MLAWQVDPIGMSAAGVVELGGSTGANSTSVHLTGNRTGVSATWELPHVLSVVALSSGTASPRHTFMLEVCSLTPPH
jgi:hypothetical protein